jgi:arylsulfatase A-like enzyme
VHIQGTVRERFADRSLFGQLKGHGYHTLAFTHNLVTSSLLYQFATAIDQLSPIREVALADLNRAESLVPRDLTVAVHSEGVLTRRGDGPSSSLFLYHLNGLWNRFVLQEPHQRYADDYPRGLPGGHNLFFLLETAIDWTMQQLTSAPEPFVAYLHFLPPHDPYNPRREFVGLFDDDWHPPRKPSHPLGDGHPTEFLDRLRRQYDEHIAYVDAEFGRLADFLESSGLTDTTYVFVTSDHGELFERGIWQHITPVLYEPVIRVPFVVGVPGQRQRVDVRVPTSVIDLMPTLTHLAGASQPAWSEGQVLPGLADLDAPTDRDVYSMDAKSSSKEGPLDRRTLALIKGRHKLIHYVGYDGYDDVYEMYDLEEDPEEMNDIYSSRRETAAELTAILRAKWADVASRETQ